MEKYWYTMSLNAEESAQGNVLLTKKEAKIVANAIDQMYKNLTGGNWCGSVFIDIEHPRADKYDFGEENYV